MKPFVVVAFVVLTACAASAEEKKPTDALQGEWKVIAVTAVAQDVPKEKFEKWKVEIKAM